MKTFSYQTDSGLVAPQAVADVDQLVINRSAGTFFLKFLIWASIQAKRDGRPPIGEISMQLSGDEAQALKAQQAQLYGSLESAAFAVAANLFPNDATDVV